MLTWTWKHRCIFLLYELERSRYKNTLIAMNTPSAQNLFSKYTHQEKEMRVSREMAEPGRGKKSTRRSCHILCQMQESAPRWKGSYQDDTRSKIHKLFVQLCCLYSHTYMLIQSHLPPSNLQVIVLCQRELMPWQPDRLGSWVWSNWGELRNSHRRKGPEPLLRDGLACASLQNSLCFSENL